MNSLTWYLVAAAGEISGCFAFWAWLRMGRNAGWAVLGIVNLVVFAAAITRVDAALAGRAFAAYGGVYIVSSLLWMWGVEGTRPDRWDAIGGAVCVAGAAVILYGPRTS